MGIASPARFFLTEDSGQTWTQVYRNDDEAAFFDAVAFFDEKRGMAFGDPMNGRLALIVTTDGGKTWQDVDREKIPLAAEGEGGFAASGTCLAVSANGLALIGLGGAVPGGKARVMRSEDFGASWTVAESPLRADAASGIFSLCVLGTDEKELHIVGVGGNYQDEKETSDTAMLSTDGGQTWQAIEDKSPSGYRSGVAVMPGSTGKLLVACGPSGMDISHDGGQSWSPLAGAGYHAVSFAADGTGWLTGSEGRIARIELAKERR
jgi:photosystem II stability/assembly factor-like uncharacterized protein